MTRRHRLHQKSDHRRGMFRDVTVRWQNGHRTSRQGESRDGRYVVVNDMVHMFEFGFRLCQHPLGWVSRIQFDDPKKGLNYLRA